MAVDVSGCTLQVTFNSSSQGTRKTWKSRAKTHVCQSMTVVAALLEHLTTIGGDMKRKVDFRTFIYNVKLTVLGFS